MGFPRILQAGSNGGGGGDLLAANNLSDLDDALTARSNLGLADIAASGSAGDLSTGTVSAARFPANVLISTVGIVIDGGGVVLTTGQKGYIQVPFAGTITEVTLLADQSGSAVVDVWKDTYANYPPTVADTITAAAIPTISAATKSQDSTLTGWTTAVAAGDILGFNINSVSTITRLILQLKIVRT